MNKNPRGAPTKPPEERKGSVLTIRLTAAEREAIDIAADGKASTWARDVLVRAAKRRGK